MVPMGNILMEISVPLDKDRFIEMECDFCKNRFMLHKDVYEKEDNINFFALYVDCLIRLILFCPRGFGKDTTEDNELYV